MVTGAVELRAQSSTAPAGQNRQNAAWVTLFDGKSLEGWRETPFTRKGKVRVEESAIVLEYGAPMTGVTIARDFPKDDYEIRFEAARMQGNDFFASLTFPIGEAFCTWVLGGWGGDIVGVSSIDGWDASENMTRSYFNFENAQWYKLRLRVSDHRIRAWIDDEQVVNVDVAGRELSLRRGEIELSAPLGFASYNTTGRLRNIEYRRLTAASSTER
jgi:hypothetical protein